MDKSTLSILAVEDEETLLQMLTRILEREGYYVDTAPNGRIAISMLQTLPYDIALLDIMMPEADGIEVLTYIKEHKLDTEVIMISAIQDVNVVVECMKLGAFYYTLKPYIPRDLVALIERAAERKRLVMHNEALKRQVEYHSLPATMVGKSASLLEIVEKALRVAPTDSPVLIQGEKGSGKELVANIIHAKSLRSDQPFLALNCSSMDERLLEGELFGHEQGVLPTEMNRKRGLLEIARGGTILLDHVADLPHSLQSKLFEFTKTGRFKRLGGDTPLQSDVRFISATNKDLQSEAASGRFSDELLLALNVITLELPPLRNRKEDIPMLAEHFLSTRGGARPPKSIDDSAMKALLGYEWPCNVRELENVIERAAVLSKGDVITLEDLAHFAGGSFTKKKAALPAPSHSVRRTPSGRPRRRLSLHRAVRRLKKVKAGKKARRRTR